MLYFQAKTTGVCRYITGVFISIVYKTSHVKGHNILK